MTVVVEQSRESARSVAALPLEAAPEARVLVFELLPDALSAADLIDDFDVDLARRIGRAVGELHGTSATLRRDTTHVPYRLEGPLSALTPEQYAACSGAELEVWALLQHDRQMKKALAGLAERSRVAPRVPSHCDLRLDQILLTGDQIHLIDWEEFRAADPALDVGSFVGEWLYRAASSMFADVGAVGRGAADMHDMLARREARELEVVRPLVTAFWAGYRRERTPDAGLAKRATAYAGWHLFDRMLANARFSAQLGALERGIAGIGRSALTSASEFVGTIGLEDA